MDALTRLQQWYRNQCNGDWEHSWGIKIGTLDNPGWTIDIDLHETDVEDVPFCERSHGLDPSMKPNGVDWLVCKVEQNVFSGRGGPLQLSEMIEVFLDWAQKK